MSSQAEIHEMVSSKEFTARRRAAVAQDTAFAHLPDKDQGWKDLLRLTKYQDGGVRWGAVLVISSLIVGSKNRIG